MSWTQIKNATIPGAGSLRSAAMYSALVDRSAHLLTNYTPIIGGVSPGSFIAVGAGTTSTYCHPVICPAAGTCSFVFAAHTVGSGVGVVTFATSSGSAAVAVPVSATTVAQYTITGIALSGSADRCTVTVQNTAGSGSVQVYGGTIIATSAAGAELNELPPDVEALESGQPITADCVRRLGDSLIYMARKRPPALSYFTSRARRTGAETHTITSEITQPAWYTLAHGRRPYHNCKVSFTAATSTYCRTYDGWHGFTSTQGGGVGTIATHTFPALQTSRVSFTNSAGTAFAPVESFVWYEDVP